MAKGTKVKLFHLLPSGTWGELGIGTAIVTPGALTVIGKDARPLIRHGLDPEWPYQLQNQTMLSFHEDGKEHMLSFLSIEAASSLREEIMHNRKPPEKRQNLSPPPGNGAVFSPTTMDIDKEGPQAESNKLADKPPVLAYENLQELADWFEASCEHPVLRDRASSFAIKGEYVKRLLDMFDRLEDLDDIEALHRVHRIIVSFFNLSSFELTQELTAQATLPRTIAALEYNPVRSRINHRAFLHSVQFCNPLGVAEDVGEVMKQTYFFQYLRETVIPTVTNEGLVQLAMQARQMAVRILGSHDDQVAEALAKLQQGDGDLVTILRCMQELTTASKTLPVQHRTEVIGRLLRNGLLGSTQVCADHAERGVRQGASEILSQLMFIDPSLLRDYIQGEANPKSDLLEAIMLQTIKEEDLGLQAQWQELAKLLVETRAQREKYAIMGGPAQIELTPRFKHLLYATDSNDTIVLDCLLHPLTYHPDISSKEECPEAFKWIHENPPTRADQALYAASPVIAACLSGHGKRASAWALRREVPQKVAALLQAKKLRHQLTLACLWIIRACVEASDPRLHNELATSNALGPLMGLLRRDGLLPSALLSVLEATWKENRVALVEQIGSTYHDVLEKVKCPTAKHFLTRYQKNKEDNAGAPSGLSGLVSYDDGNDSDEEDGDYPEVKRRKLDTEDTMEIEVEVAR